MSQKAIRKLNRSGTMMCPICQSMERLVEHHIHGREVKGWTKPWNKVWLCPNHHDALHAGQLFILGWFFTSHGRELIWYTKGENPPDFGDSVNFPAAIIEFSGYDNLRGTVQVVKAEEITFLDRPEQDM